MIRKLITAGAAAALILSAAMPALASGRHHRSGGDFDVSFEDNYAVAISNTGLNAQEGRVRGGGTVNQYMDTGNSYADAYQELTVEAGCDCVRRGDFDVDFKDNYAVAISNTGLNEQNGYVTGSSRHHHGGGGEGLVDQTMFTGRSEAWATQVVSVTLE